MSDSYLSQSINNILSIARLAPSVHNSQPWKVKVEGNNIRILLAKERMLSHGDPTTRQSYISLGIFTEACVLSLSYFGFKPKEPTFSNGELLIETGNFSEGKKDRAHIKALQERFTDRSIYQKIDVSKTSVKAIKDSWSSPTVSIEVTTDKGLMHQCASLTEKALLLAFSNPDFRRELSEFITANRASPLGIPSSTLEISSLHKKFIKQLLKRGLTRNREAKTEYNRWLSSSAIVFILGSGDSKSHWIEAGRAYLRASLALQDLGYSQATSAAIVEAADFHEDIESALGTNRRILCVLRIGKGRKSKLSSGRLDPASLIAT